MSQCVSGAYLVLVSIVLCCSPIRAMAANEVIDIDLADTSTEEFVDLLYEFAGQNRLSVEWFGWYTVDSPSHWFERSVASRNDFKITLYLMSIDLGYVVFTSGFDEGRLKAAINSGDSPKDEWLAIIGKLKEELRAQNLTH
jgi:hypothetical protein